MSRRRKRHWNKEKWNNKQGESQNSKPTEEVIKEKKSNDVNNKNKKTDVRKSNSVPKRKHKIKEKLIIVNEQEKKVRIPVAKDVTKRCSTVFNQFICIECYRTNAIIENKSKATPLYQEKNIYCNTCNKETAQICVKDKTTTKADLELTPDKTEKESKIYQMIKKSNYRSNK